jgi:hypothetical protein
MIASHIILYSQSVDIKGMGSFFETQKRTCSFPRLSEAEITVMYKRKAEEEEVQM